LLPFLLGPINSVFKIYIWKEKNTFKPAEEISADLFKSLVLLCPYLHRTACFQGLNSFVLNGRPQFQDKICNECQKDGGIQKINSIIYILNIIIIISIKLSQNRLTEHEARKKL